jgi:anti-anti-sigma regulatory factor
MSTPSSAKTTTPTPLKIEGNLDIQHAEGVHKLFLSQPASPMVLDLSAVAACDVTGIQLLLSARKTATDAGEKFLVSAYSPAVVTACAGLGIDVSELSTSSL